MSALAAAWRTTTTTRLRRVASTFAGKRRGLGPQRGNGEPATLPLHLSSSAETRLLHPSAKPTRAMATVAGGKSLLVSPSWVASKILGGASRAGDVVVLDGSWAMPASSRNTRAEFIQKRLPVCRAFWEGPVGEEGIVPVPSGVSGGPGHESYKLEFLFCWVAHAPCQTARFFDIDEIKDRNTDLPHMLPTAEEFAAAVGSGAGGGGEGAKLALTSAIPTPAKFGVRPESHIVVYDSAGAFSACRVYWTFRAFNHLGPLSILDGGLPAWVREGHPVASGPEDVVETAPVEDLRRTYKLNGDLVRTYDQVVRNISARSEQVVDARSSGRFSGAEPEPRQGLSSGHIPGALSVPYGSVLLNPESPDGSKFRDPRDIERVFKESGVDMSKPVITSCGERRPKAAALTSAPSFLPGTLI
ncbi:MAG: Rhodanese-like domain-containing protein [Olpidium bornovanus]|uniref:Rhodanese-like domain-containing protein n=1 Tax=Olpidium bornovanus TaxID=278681 RepID=A0A8H7ZM05_9FUNG|nr:MAG: Rhodanese-like domain-containing protein [Olpidium bornovanus]